jgi:hypothetical protein
MSDCYDLRALIVGFGSSGRLAGAYGTVFNRHALRLKKIRASRRLARRLVT